MQLKKIIITLYIFIFVIISYNGIFAVSSAVKSEQDYIFTLTHIRNLNIIISNFADSDLSKSYKEIQEIFNITATEFYGQNFAYKEEKTKKNRTRFHELKMQLSIIFEKLAQNYLDRTKELLDSTSHRAFKILITFGRRPDLIKYFNSPVDPLDKDRKKPYTAGEFHFYNDKQVIERYLKRGYRKLSKARLIFNDQDLMFIKSKKDYSSNELTFIIDKYAKVIENCRMAKKYGIEIYKIIEKERLQGIIKKYNLRSTVTIDAAQDDRIPEKYKVDAYDNDNLIFRKKKEEATFGE